MKICITNNLGRPYLITYIPKASKENYCKYLQLNRGINIVDNEIFEKVKDHPMVKIYLEKKIFEVSTAIEAEKEKHKQKVEHIKEEKHK